MDHGIRLEVGRSIERFRFNEAELRKLISGPVVADLTRRAIRVEAAAKRNASQPHRVGGDDGVRRYTGSEPGHGPAVRTGRLRASITFRLGRDLLGPYADVGSSVLYAPYVELGTSRMKARPYLRPALQAARL